MVLVASNGGGVTSMFSSVGDFSGMQATWRMMATPRNTYCFGDTL
jgi:hypothetical protein